MSSDIHKELQDLASGEGAYNIPGWMSNSSEVFDLFLSRNVVIPRNELPSVKRATHDENTYYTDRENVMFTSVENARMWVMRDVAVWQFIEHEASVLAAQESEKAAARNKRRDELAREFVEDGAYAYHFAEEPLKLAIDRILDLEQAAS